SAAVEELLEGLARLEAQAFARDTVTLGDDVARTVLVLGEAGDTLALVRIAATEQTWTWRATAAGKAAAEGLGEDVFELAGWRVDRVAPGKGKVVGSGSWGRGGHSHSGHFGRRVRIAACLIERPPCQDRRSGRPFRCGRRIRRGAAFQQGWFPEITRTAG